ncbi:MAG: hypothetical protein JWO94_1890, partial [Verrucomicrobiaceae bacterium]|nr:hypothetical protein [Verrucomicrobiaceae bacterium]
MGILKVDEQRMPSLKNLRREIRTFLAHQITPVEAIIGKYPVETVLAQIDWNLRHCRAQGMILSMGFLRDALLYSHPRKDLFRQGLKLPLLWNTLSSLLVHRHAGVRRNAIYTIGKLTVRSKAKLLRAAFPFYLNGDADNMGGLMFELRWLTRKWDSKLIAQILESPHYLLRWSLCSSTYENGSLYLDRLKCVYEVLATDEHPWVSAEAVRLWQKILDPCREDDTNNQGPSFDVLSQRMSFLPQPHTLA